MAFLLFYHPSPAIASTSAAGLPAGRLLSDALLIPLRRGRPAAVLTEPCPESEPVLQAQAGPALARPPVIGLGEVPVLLVRVRAGSPGVQQPVVRRQSNQP